MIRRKNDKISYKDNSINGKEKNHKQSKNTLW